MFTGTQNIKYAKDTRTAVFQGKPITITDYTPVLSPEQREKRKKEIERTLYGIFKKYVDKPKKSA